MKYQVMPELTEDEYKALKADIAERGVMVPIEFDEDGNVLDGHHRLRACMELKIKDYPKITRTGMTEAEKRIHAMTLNSTRRHLTQEQKREIIRNLIKESPGNCSERELARIVGVSNSTVSLIRRRLVESGEVCDPRYRASKKMNEYYPQIGESLKVRKKLNEQKTLLEKNQDEIIQYMQRINSMDELLNIFGIILAMKNYVDDLLLENEKASNRIYKSEEDKTQGNLKKSASSFIIQHSDLVLGEDLGDFTIQSVMNEEIKPL